MENTFRQSVGCSLYQGSTVLDRGLLKNSVLHIKIYLIEYR